MKILISTLHWLNPNGYTGNYVVIAWAFVGFLLVLNGLFRCAAGKYAMTDARKVDWTGTPCPPGADALGEGIMFGMLWPFMLAFGMVYALWRGFRWYVRAMLELPMEDDPTPEKITIRVNNEWPRPDLPKTKPLPPPRPPRQTVGFRSKPFQWESRS